MNNERFRILDDGAGQLSIIDDKERKRTRKITDCCNIMNNLNDENARLKEQLHLVLHASSINEYYTVKEVLKEHIEGLDTVAENSPGAWDDYVTLSKLYHEIFNEKI